MLKRRSASMMILLVFITIIVAACDTSSNSNDNYFAWRDLTESSDGYIHINPRDFHNIINQGDIFLTDVIYEFDDIFDGRKFAITGTLVHDVAYGRLLMHDGENHIIGGHRFDYDSLFNTQIAYNMDNDGKNVIIKGTHRNGDFLEDMNIRQFGYLEIISIEIID
jgi:hypothetical protein